MGCDIHPYVEKKLWGTWHMIHHIQSYKDMSDCGGDRDYDFFAHLCGVRTDRSGWPEPKGLPEDVSVVCQYESDKWDCDGHSHSWETAKDFMEKKLALMKVRGDDKNTGGRLEYYAWRILGYETQEDEDLSDYRVVFWFDN